jgi:hypothetical protein
MMNLVQQFLFLIVFLVTVLNDLFVNFLAQLTLSTHISRFMFHVFLFAIIFLFKGSKDKLTAFNSPAFLSYYTEVTLAQCK